MQIAVETLAVQDDNFAILDCADTGGAAAEPLVNKAHLPENFVCPQCGQLNCPGRAVLEYFDPAGTDDIHISPNRTLRQ